MKRDISAEFPTMAAEITTRKVGTKWHGYIAGRPDLDETALTEEAVRRKMEQLRVRIGVCGANPKLFGGRTCELIAGHHEHARSALPGVERLERWRITPPLLGRAPATLGPDLDRLRTEWGIAKVILAGGKYDEAIRRLRDVSSEFEKRQMVTDAALVGLDIIEALLADGKKRRIIALAQHLFSVFTNAGKLTGALSALAYLKEVAATGELKLRDLNDIRTFLRRAEVQPRLQFIPRANSPEDSV